MSHSDWVDWWLQTDYGSKSKISWDVTHVSGIWKDYFQVAHSADGAAKVMCKRCCAILEHPYTTKKDANRKVGRHSTTTMTRHLKTTACDRTPTDNPFSQEGWEDDLLQFITINRLPFHLIEHRIFQSLISRAHSAPNPLTIPSADTIRRRLSIRVLDRQ
ncbi:hypothetical protein PENARI_c033G10472 [Penicillium arizonense]|uniref:Uncharacterized protein n=1 Tax=Penicillium arizonense TaxID=1835702 RepID=A0A1F5L466_PENAI|nr:hypothetical protein PENARI_c033G10472 [Penicillium arizonense]OGE48028.1 hypothetical protein PENARI_c033G10472 [Penicillium arizonense]